MSLRDTLLQLGFVMIAGGAVFATWALLTGPLGRFTRTGDIDEQDLDVDLDLDLETIDDEAVGEVTPSPREQTSPARRRRAPAAGRRNGSSQARS